MQEQANVQSVSAMYAAFARHDISGILVHMDESIFFLIPGSPAVPLSGARRGLRQVRCFFEELDARCEFSSFEPRDFIAQGNHVVALVRYEGRDRTTGRAFSAASAMVWSFGNGKAIRFQEFTDTEALANAARQDSQAFRAG